ncbi:DUF4358 domain-containing protein [Paenibacillus sp. GCM10027627]|uniref:DUF4358 domain-containing protein n=1 Tax=unclassified Paenibacillus TaxID=185978 RepID=UPI0036374C0C
MINNKKLFKTMTALTIALSLFAAGCSNGKGSDAESSAAPSASAGTSTEPSGSPEATVSPSASATAEPSATPEASAEPSAAPSESAAATDKPAVKPSEKPTTEPSKKPTAKPSEKPPAAKPKPTDKPAAGKPSAKPSEKPSVKPSTKPSEKPKPTPKPDPEGAIKTSDIVDKILADVQLPALLSVTGDAVEDWYYFKASDYISEGSFNQAMMNTKATELVVVKLKSEKHYDAVKEGLTKRAEDIIDIFSRYLPDQYEDAKNYQILRNGNYVLLSISHDQEAVKKAFESFFK